MFSVPLAALLLALLGLLLVARQPAARSATHALADDVEAPRGLSLTFRSQVKDFKGGEDTRVARLVSLHVPEKEPPTPFLPPGPFTATWQGQIVLELGEEVTFSAEGRGKLRVEVNGAVVLEAAGDDFRKAADKAVKLRKDANALVVSYDSPATGDAQVRLFWESAEFRREPVGWNVLHHQAGEVLSTSQRLRQGRELVATLRCLKCHTAETEKWVRDGGMPELAMDAPSLSEIGGRVNREWLARWVQDPHSLRPTATMPRIFPDAPTGLDGKIDDRALDISAFLAGLGSMQKADAEGKGAREAGTRLFVHLGCISCHTPPEAEDYADDADGRIPLRDVGAKWNRKALEEFLRQPDRHYSWVRMPNFNLSAEEAHGLAVFIASPRPRKLAEVDWDKADPERGRKLVLESGCLNCHALEEKGGKKLESTLKAADFARLAGKEKGGCLDTKSATTPRFGLKDEQRSAVQAFLGDGRDSLRRDSSAEFASRQVRALQCLACHRREGQPDRWSERREDAEGLLADLPPLDPDSEPKQYIADQVRPTLTWTGEKLKPEWTEALLAGKLKYKPRPYLRARMPAFPRRAEVLARGLASEHGCPPVSPADPAPDEKLIPSGTDLVSKARWGCVSCHDVGKTEAVGVFESPGPNFMYIRERLRREYYDRWLWAPTRVEPDTKMPSVYTYGQKSLLSEIHGGDPGKQIDAMWHYLLQGDRIKPPAER